MVKAALFLVLLAGCSRAANGTPPTEEPTPKTDFPVVASSTSGPASTEITGVANGWWENPAAHCPAGSQFSGSYPGKSKDPADWVAECFNETDGVRMGPFTSWWPNGKKQEEGMFADDNATGTWAEWNETGELVSTRRYGEDGELEEAVSYKDGAPIKP